MSETPTARLGAGKYLLITSYRRNGQGVPTPVWVVGDGDALGAWTVADSWKVKRIRNNSAVEVAPCDLRGNRTGEAFRGTAEICDAATTARYRKLIARKYGVVGRLTLLGSRLRRGTTGTVGIRITLDPA
ncbi:PPOX class F420-dependent oxidoreductase [Streptomyces sp. NPDC001595]|uniref:PPOX class F420-dependent oxidoreductase n=1 Tax=Streptomyces sp. NPDC001532 TaxID=3154520 RepID=UPI0033210EA5